MLPVWCGYFFIYLNWFVLVLFSVYSCLCVHFPLHLSVGQWAPSVFISKKQEPAAMTYLLYFVWDFQLMCFEYENKFMPCFFTLYSLIKISHIIDEYNKCIIKYGFVCGKNTFRFSLGTDAIIAFLTANMTFHFHGTLLYSKTIYYILQSITCVVFAIISIYENAIYAQSKIGK